MALASAKQLLDELMGRNRNLAPDDKKNLSGFEEQEVCKHFLVNFCPNELFVNTKADLGPCSRVHDERLKAEYEKSSQFRKLGFEEDFFRFCQGMLGDVEKRIRRAKQRLALGNQENHISNPTPPSGPKTNEEEKMHVISERINELLEQVEQLGCEGKVEEAQGIMKLCDQLKEEREAIKRAMEPQHWLQQTAEIAAAQEKQMEVCEVCGAFLIVGDAQQRVDDHLMGKQHVGYARLKAAVEEIMFKRDKEKEEREKQRNKERLERQKQREEEEKSRGRGRSKDRHERTSSAASSGTANTTTSTGGGGSSSGRKDSSSGNAKTSYRDRNGYQRRSRSPRENSKDKERRKSLSQERGGGRRSERDVRQEERGGGRKDYRKSNSSRGSRRSSSRERNTAKNSSSSNVGDHRQEGAHNPRGGGERHPRSRSRSRSRSNKHHSDERSSSNRSAPGGGGGGGGGGGERGKRRSRDEEEEEGTTTTTLSYGNNSGHKEERNKMRSPDSGLDSFCYENRKRNSGGGGGVENVEGGVTGAMMTMIKGSRTGNDHDSD